jgi:PadR family transcriptional regulator PadR
MRMTRHARTVLVLLLERSDDVVYGFEMMQRSGLRSGTIYPLLARMELNGFVHGAWEDVDAAEVGRPRRRLYRLTAMGTSLARELEQASDSETARIEPGPPVSWPHAFPA